MAERWLKVFVTKEQGAHVYLRVDDTDPRFADTFLQKSGRDGKLLPHLTTAAHDAAIEAAEQTVDWSLPSPCDTVSAEWNAVEVPADEAKQYPCWDAGAACRSVGPGAASAAE